MPAQYAAVAARAAHRCEYCDHFTVSVRGDTVDQRILDLAIYGVTPVGRATIAALHMNSSAQLNARRWWAAIGLFP